MSSFPSLNPKFYCLVPKSLLIGLSIILVTFLFTHPAHSQNVGIGTLTPEDPLHLIGNMRISGGRLFFASTGQSVFVGDSAGLNDDLTDNRNTFIGHHSGRFMNTGSNNIALGPYALDGASETFWNIGIGTDALGSGGLSGNLNTAIGHFALSANALGQDNVAMGQNALGVNTSGSSNISIGNYALDANTTGYDNTVIGYEALGTNITGVKNTVIGSNGGHNVTGSFNTLIGTESGYTNSSGEGNVFLGFQAGFFETGSNKLFIANSSTSNPLLYGDFSLKKLTINDTLSSKSLYLTEGAVDGYVLKSNASGRSSWVNPSTLFNNVWSISGNDIYKNNSGNVGIGTTTPGDKLHVVGDLRIEGGRIKFVNPHNSTFFGQDAGLNEDLNERNNTFIGYKSGENTVVGWENTAIGSGALYSNVNGYYNVAVGRQTLKFNNSTNNTAIGGGAGYSSTGANNTFIGADAGANNVGNNNVFLGSGAGALDVSGSDKLYIDNSNTSSPLLYGEFDQNRLTVNDTLITGSMRINSGKLSFINTGQSIFIGQDAGKNDDLTTNRNVHIGYNAGKSNTTGADNISIGSGALDSAAAVSFSIAIGTDALGSSSLSGVRNTAIGYNSMKSMTTGNYNVGLGPNTLQQTTTGGGNVALGSASMLDNTTGHSNVGVGKNALTYQTTGYQNTAVGYHSGYALMTGNNNSFFGIQAGNQSNGTNNTMLGSNAGYTNSSGIGNVFLGNQAGYNETGSNKLYIANSNTVTPLLYGEFDKRRLTINDTLITHTIQIDSGRINFSNRSIFLGTNAGMSDDLSYNDNVFIGDQAARNNIHGHHNVAVGNESLFSTTGGDYNVTIGYQSGYLNTGNDNAFLGAFAGYNIDGWGNVCLGYRAGQNATGSNKLYIANSETSSPLIYGEFEKNRVTINDTLSTERLYMTEGIASNINVNAGRLSFINTGNSVFIGEDAGMSDDMTDNKNTFVGFYCGQANTSGYENIAIGYNGLADNTSGFQNVAIGNEALSNNISGFYNVALGFAALNGSTIGTGNVAIGWNALPVNDATDNVALGFGSGFTNNGTGNVFVGSGAGQANNGNGNVFIGKEAGSSATGSNKLYIENSSASVPLIYGEFDNNEVGINTSTPSSTFEVVGSIGVSIKNNKVAGTDNPDASGVAWRFTSGTGTITLPTASTCANRAYIIMNQTGATRDITSHTNLAGNVVSTIGNSASITLISDGTGWFQID